MESLKGGLLIPRSLTQPQQWAHPARTLQHLSVSCVCLRDAKSVKLPFLLATYLTLPNLASLFSSLRCIASYPTINTSLPLPFSVFVVLILAHELTAASIRLLVIVSYTWSTLCLEKQSEATCTLSRIVDPDPTAASLFSSHLILQLYLCHTCP